MTDRKGSIVSGRTTADTTQPQADRRQDGATGPALSGWRHGSTWTYLIMLIASAAALFVSFMLSAETLRLARRPNQLLGCDINSVLSCSDVARSWQAELVRLGDLSFPNAFFGIAAESVFVTIAVIGLARVRVPRWFATCTWLGGLAAILFSYWLTVQSLFVIRALCPWCLGLMFSTTIQFMALSHATVTVQDIPRGGRGLRTYYRLNYDLMADVVWVLAIIAIILVKDGSAIFR
ncbi:vitamin K epoxide reductase family protein [Bifidobacterium thermophilum]|uniref:vitamin K epoxide reductase family protein n=1 Tax=Bifidobacterium thermophilum TaxID=33905 RepID=UPI003BB723B0